MDLTGSGNTAVVTGGASGLGAATAVALSQRGMKVALLDLDERRGPLLAEAVGGLFERCDVGDPEDVKEALSRVRAHLGQETVCVNCAGLALARPTLFHDEPHEAGLFERILRVNLLGTFVVSCQSAAGMARNDPVGPDRARGVIVNTASMAAFEGQIGHAAYAASKAGIVGMTLPMARDLARDGIRVVTLAPGMFQTPMASGLQDRHRDRVLDAVAHPHRAGRPEEFAALVLHCLENPMLNGETLRLDAGCRMPPK